MPHHHEDAELLSADRKKMPMGLVGGMPNTRKHDSRHAVTGHNSHQGHSLKKDDIHLFYETNAARKCEFQGGAYPQQTGYRLSGF